MAHYSVLVIGTTQDLQNIYDDCPDSSSESDAEMAFGYDYLVPHKEYEEGHLITKGGDVYKDKILNRQYCDCLDCRDRKLYTCIDSIDYEHRKSLQEMRDFFESLPEGTTFFYCDAHL